MDGSDANSRGNVGNFVVPGEWYSCKSLVTDYVSDTPRPRSVL